MKVLTVSLIVIAALFLSCSSSDSDKKDMHYYRMFKQTYYKQGNVREYYTYTTGGYGQRSGESVNRSDGKSYETTRKVLRKGNSVKVLVYDKKGKLKSYTKQLYKNDNVTILKRSYFDKNDKLLKYTDFTYNNEGALLKRESFDSQKKLHGYSMEFDSSGNLIKDKRYKNGVLMLFHSHEYDKESRVVQINRFDGISRLISYRVFKYNKKGFLKEHLNYLATGKISSRVESEYNSKGKRIVARYYEGSSNGKTHLQFYKIFQYKKGNLVRVATFNRFNKILGSGVYDYDAKGNKTRQKYFDKKGKMMGFSTYSYEGL